MNKVSLLRYLNKESKLFKSPPLKLYTQQLIKKSISVCVSCSSNFLSADLININVLKYSFILLIFTFYLFINSNIVIFVLYNK